MFRDEDIAYATRLMQAGVPTELQVYAGVFHGAEGFAPRLTTVPASCATNSPRWPALNG